MIRIALLVFISAVLISNVEAKPRLAPAAACQFFCPDNNPFSGARSIKVSMHRERYSGIVSHPAGCPSRAFCGCGASIRVFGHSVRDLWLAANWFKFPRSAPGSGMVAVRRHHVMVLESQVEGSTWIVYDPNSGGHVTRIHARSIAGYTIVNPRV